MYVSYRRSARRRELSGKQRCYSKAARFHDAQAANHAKKAGQAAEEGSPWKSALETTLQAKEAIQSVVKGAQDQISSNLPLGWL